MKNTGILQLVSVFQVANISFRKWDKHNPTPNQHEPKAFPANMFFFDTTFLWHLNHINIHAHMIYYICLSFQFFSFSFQGKQVVPKKSQAALRWRHGRSGSVDLAMILKSIEVASAAPEGAKVVMSSTCERREQFRLEGCGYVKRLLLFWGFTVNSFMMKWRTWLTDMGNMAVKKILRALDWYQLPA